MTYNWLMLPKMLLTDPNIDCGRLIYIELQISCNALCAHVKICHWSSATRLLNCLSSYGDTDLASRVFAMAPLDWMSAHGNLGNQQATSYQIDGLMQKKHNPSTLAMELRLVSIKPVSCASSWVLRGLHFPMAVTSQRRYNAVPL